MHLAQFLEFLEDRAGDTLRAVNWYRGAESELIYVREDLDVETMDQRASHIHTQITGAPTASEPTDMIDLGDELATVNLYEEAVIVHLRVTADSGVVIGLDTIAARSLHDFIMDCRENLTGDDTP